MHRTHSSRWQTLTRAALRAGAASALALAPLACGGGVPEVSGTPEPVLPPGPQRQAQALSSPDTTSDSSGANADAYCLDGESTEQSYNQQTGEFSSTWTCAPGGGIATIQNVGQTSPITGDGAYDQITTFEDGSQLVWHFTVDVSEDFLVQRYHGEAADGSESYDGVYTYRDDGNWDVNDVWNMAEGTYTIVGVQAADGSSFDGRQVFDDPNTAQSPDWEMDYILNPDGTFSQGVTFHGEGYSSVYDYTTAVDGSAVYNFATDLHATDAAPDFEGSYSYNADMSGTGGYVQNFDDGSLLTVHDVIHANGTVVESWTFDDVSTGLAVDQEGTITYAPDGSAEGTFTLHSEGGGSQTCNIRISASGEQTIDNCQ